MFVQASKADGLLRTEDSRSVCRFTESSLATAQPALSPGLRSWLAGRRRAVTHQVEKIPLAELHGWRFEEATGNLVHQSGRFFAFEGLHVQTDRGPVPQWWQPIINQPEIGILGILAKEIDGVLHFLMQAKAEPGNINGLQISPTVQATRSNYSRVHRGSPTKYLEYFVERAASRVLVDVLQSEQGSWFLGKRNRNMIVETTDDVPPDDDFYWCSLSEIKELLRFDNMVNMDARTVLSCIPFAGSQPMSAPRATGGDHFSAALVRSLSAVPGSLNSATDVLSWFTEAKTRHGLTARRVPLRGLPQWHRSEHEIAHESGRHFRVVAVDVTADNREVARWRQPMLAPCGRGVVAIIAKIIDGVLHFLVQARIQHGHLDTVEIGPTVQCIPDSYTAFPPQHRPTYLDYVLGSTGSSRIRYDQVHSEEGGRFYHAENRYMVVEAGDDFPVQVPSQFCWVTLHQLIRLLRHSHYLNVEARSVVSCVNTLW
ncbi:NDP-hexose 2,3-dehydratase family protein [Micromonospora sp. FIMYZ51]|uniref:NDP-hexose 2,3-dehydratase family protein n=1 Tax=Micromonospora sp. FIMYZ51 TaxID=3051832 RepID=UPI0031201693